VQQQLKQPRPQPHNTRVWVGDALAHRTVVSLRADYQILAATSDEQAIRTALLDVHSCKAPYVCVDELHGSSARMRRCLRLGPDARKILNEPNAGGKSIVSESFSMEHLCRRFGASDVRTELEIRYWNDNWKKVDFLCQIHGQSIGVSVSRAMGFPDPASFTMDDAQRLIVKKLYGLVVAMQGIDDEHRQDFCVLHIFCQTPKIAGFVQLAFLELVTRNRDVDYSGIVVLLTVAETVPEIFANDLAIVQRNLQCAREPAT